MWRLTIKTNTMRQTEYKIKLLLTDKLGNISIKIDSGYT